MWFFFSDDFWDWRVSRIRSNPTRAGPPCLFLCLPRWISGSANERPDGYLISLWAALQIIVYKLHARSVICVLNPPPVRFMLCGLNPSTFTGWLVIVVLLILHVRVTGAPGFLLHSVGWRSSSLSSPQSHVGKLQTGQKNPQTGQKKAPTWSRRHKLAFKTKAWLIKCGLNPALGEINRSLIMRA